MVSTSPFREQVLREISYMTLDSTCLQSEVDVLASFLSLSSFLLPVVLGLVLHGLLPPFFAMESIDHLLRSSRKEGRRDGAAFCMGRSCT
jgi:hypothetical protein